MKPPYSHLQKTQNIWEPPLASSAFYTHGGSKLSFHPHVHCIVSDGGITNNDWWKEAINNDRFFLFPVKALSIVFRTKFLKALQQMISNGEIISTKKIANNLSIFFTTKIGTYTQKRPLVVRIQ